MMSEEHRILPVVAIRQLTMLPGMMIHFDVHKETGVQAIQAALREGKQVLVVTQKNALQEEPGEDDLYRMGTISQIKQMIKMPGNQIRVLASGICRGYLEHICSTVPYLEGEVSVPEERNEESLTPMEQKAMLRGLKDILDIYAKTNEKFGKDILGQLKAAKSVDELINQVAVSVPLPVEARQKILETVSVAERYEALAAILSNEIEILRIKADLQNKVREKVDKNQKEYILREQLKVIREELGEGNTADDAEEFFKKLSVLDASEEVKAKIKREIERFKAVAGSPSESAVTRTYVETLLSLPWNKATKDDLDIVRAEKILDKDHYGLEKVKERILEFLSVRALNEKGQTPILCLVGPPGTGKTSVARSVARALRKEYVRICLGGVKDEAEIRGHRKTYVGAMPGRLIQGLKSAQVKNPLMLLDEIDKVSSDYKGDVSAALLEVLDPEQNRNFVDHYVEIPVDLSEVFFLCTANSIQTIPRPLLDRMEIIEVSSYTENEKLHIAKGYLLPKQLEKNGLTKKELKISTDALRDVIGFYTREAGVRSLERRIGELCRKAAMRILKERQAGETENTVLVNKRNLEEFLGKHKYRRNPANTTAEIGIVRGLAWTEAGGDTLQVEVNVMPGKGGLRLTGTLGDVMKESAQIALSYVRSAAADKAAEDYFDTHEFHLHVPEGAVPKDGPSAGITMATAFYSAVTECPVCADVAMTGEISLRGRVLPIGGLKEKLLAAKQAGIKKVLFPKENERDLEELSDEIRDGLELVSVSRMEEVLRHALEKYECK